MITAQKYLPYPDLARDYFNGIDPYPDPVQFIQLFQKKFRVCHGDTPSNGAALDDYNFERIFDIATNVGGPPTN